MFGNRDFEHAMTWPTAPTSRSAVANTRRWSNPAGRPADPNAPIDYPVAGYRPAASGRPAGAGLSPPVYPMPYPPYGNDPYRLEQAARHQRQGDRRAWCIALLGAAVLLACPRSAGSRSGSMAMRETQRTGQEGYGLALAGASIGALVLVFWVLNGLIAVLDPRRRFRSP